MPANKQKKMQKVIHMQYQIIPKPVKLHRSKVRAFPAPFHKPTDKGLHLVKITSQATHQSHL